MGVRPRYIAANGTRRNAKTTANNGIGRSFFAKMGTESEKSYQKVRLIQIKAVFLYPKDSVCRLLSISKNGADTCGRWMLRVARCTSSCCRR